MLRCSWQALFVGAMSFWSCLAGPAWQGSIGVMAAELEIVSETVLSTNGSTRGSAYGSASKIVTLGDKTHVAWLDTKSATMIQTYHHGTGDWLPAVHVGSGLDNHGGPALCADSRGYLHIVFGPHHGPLQHCRSERPNDASAWVRLPEFGDHATYPSLICGDDDTLYCAYRGRTAPLKLMFQRRPAGGEWSEPMVVVDAGVSDGYTQFGNCLCFGDGGALHLAFHVYDLHPAAGKAVGHLQSPDGGETWALADGTPVRLPYTPDQPGWVAASPDRDMRCWSVDCDPDGNPFLCVIRYRPKPSAVEVWSFEDGTWVSNDLGPVLAAHSEGLQATDAVHCLDDSGNLYVAAAVTGSGGWGHPTNETVLLVSSDRGKTFEVLSVPKPGSVAASWLPNLERRTGHNLVELPHLLYTYGAVGEGCAPPDVTEIRLVTLGRK